MWPVECMEMGEVAPESLEVMCASAGEEAWGCDLTSDVTIFEQNSHKRKGSVLALPQVVLRKDLWWGQWAEWHMVLLTPTPAFLYIPRQVAHT